MSGLLTNTNVLILLTDLVSHDYLSAMTMLIPWTGKGGVSCQSRQKDLNKFLPIPWWKWPNLWHIWPPWRRIHLHFYCSWQENPTSHSELGRERVVGGHKSSDQPRASYSQHLGLWLKWSWNGYAEGSFNHKEYHTDTDAEEGWPWFWLSFISLDINGTTIMQTYGISLQAREECSYWLWENVPLQEPPIRNLVILSYIIAIIKSWLGFAYLKCCTDDNTIHNLVDSNIEYDTCINLISIPIKHKKIKVIL